MRIRLVLVTALASAGLTLVASPAEAAMVRYASPTGTTAQGCGTPATACNIEKAINSAGSSDEIVLASGTYVTSTGLSNSANGLWIHGPAGGPRPVIRTTANVALYLNGTNVTVNDLVIEQTGFVNNGLNVFSGSVEVSRVVVRSSAATVCTAGIGGVFRDSLCVATSENATAVSLFYSGVSNTLKMRNITAIGLAPGSKGIQVTAGPSTTATLDARNVVASAATDVHVREESGTALVTFTNSNYDTVDNTTGTVTAAGAGTNQTAPPVFADTVLYRQALTSPTVDAGATDADTGSVDLDGNARPLGSAIDIGADELVPDRTAPTTTIGKHPKKRTTKKRARFTFVSNEPGSTFVCQLDKKAPRPCTSPFRKRLRKTGRHKLTVYAVDRSGNKDLSPATFVWRITPAG